MTTWDDKWATPQARDYQRGLLADEIAREAVIAARHQTGFAQLSEAADAWFDDSFDRCIASKLIAYARGYLDARRP